MRPPLLRLLSLACLSACAGEGGPEPSFVSNFVSRSRSAACRPAAPPGGRERSIGVVRQAGDSALVVLHPAERRVALYGPDGEVRARAAYAEDGPRRIVDPQDVGWAEGRFYVADRVGRAVMVLGDGGEDFRTIDLPFAPERVLPIAGGFLVSPLVLGPGTDQLLHAWSGMELRPLDAPARRLRDWRLEAMANQLSLIGFADGRVVALHQFIVPRGYVVDPAEGSVERVSPPVPDGVRAAFGTLPEYPFTDEDIRALPAPALDAAPDPGSGETLYLTRTGRRADGHFEKAVIRVDRRLRYVRSYLLPMNAGFLAYLNAFEEGVLVDDMDRWYRCSLP